MNEGLHLFESECARAPGLLSQLLDDELPPIEAMWLRGHLAGCAECRAALAGFSEIDSQMTDWGQRVNFAESAACRRAGAVGGKARITSVPALGRCGGYPPRQP